MAVRYHLVSLCAEMLKNLKFMSKKVIKSSKLTLVIQTCVSNAIFLLDVKASVQDIIAKIRVHAGKLDTGAAASGDHLIIASISFTVLDIR